MGNCTSEESKPAAPAPSPNKPALIRNMRFVLDEKLPQNASKFAILLEYKNPCSFFRLCLYNLLYYQWYLFLIIQKIVQVKFSVK